MLWCCRCCRCCCEDPLEPRLSRTPSAESVRGDVFHVFFPFQCACVETGRRMADDLDIEALLEAPYRKVSSLTSRRGDGARSDMGGGTGR